MFSSECLNNAQLKNIAMVLSHPGEIVGWSVVVRQKMTARHISPSEAKVAGADPIFVSGEAPAHIQQLSLPQFCPQICP